MEIGDKLYCHNNTCKVMRFTKYKIYSVHVIKRLGGDKCFGLYDDDHVEVYFTFDNEKKLPYKKWLIKLKDSRKLKIKKLNEIKNR